jgi:hypothetical protein
LPSKSLLGFAMNRSSCPGMWMSRGRLFAVADQGMRSLDSQGKHGCTTRLGRPTTSNANGLRARWRGEHGVATGFCRERTCAARESKTQCCCARRQSRCSPQLLICPLGLRLKKVTCARTGHRGQPQAARRVRGAHPIDLAGAADFPGRKWRHDLDDAALRAGHRRPTYPFRICAMAFTSSRQRPAATGKS